jgi:hypothetical protein
MAPGSGVRAMVMPRALSEARKAGEGGGPLHAIADIVIWLLF